MLAGADFLVREADGDAAKSSFNVLFGGTSAEVGFLVGEERGDSAKSSASVLILVVSPEVDALFGKPGDEPAFALPLAFALVSCASFSTLAFCILQKHVLRIRS